MYPTRELSRLAAHKAALQRQSAAHRVRIVAAASRLSQPLAWLDRAWHVWRRLAPYAVVGGLAARLISGRAKTRRRRVLPWLLRWGPMIAGLFRGGARPARSPSVPRTPSNRPHS